MEGLMMKFLVLLFPEGSNQCLLWGCYKTPKRAEKSCKSWLDIELNGRTLTLPIQNNCVFGSSKIRGGK
jgi:hypothetical protein